MRNILREFGEERVYAAEGGRTPEELAQLPKDWSQR